MSVFDPMWMKTQVIEGLIKSIEDKNEDLDSRIQSAKTLGATLGKKGTDEGVLEVRAIRVLAEALKDEDEELRKAAKAALDVIKAKQS